MGATLSDEERRLLILQAAYGQDLQEFTFLGATGVISNVFNEMLELVDFLIKNFRRSQNNSAGLSVKLDEGHLYAC
jgi:hypothetical protein